MHLCGKFENGKDSSSICFNVQIVSVGIVKNNVPSTSNIFCYLLPSYWCLIHFYDICASSPNLKLWSQIAQKILSEVLLTISVLLHVIVNVCYSVMQQSFKDLRSSSSSLVHFKLSQNLWSFEDFRLKILKIWGENPLL